MITAWLAPPMPAWPSCSQQSVSLHGSACPAPSSAQAARSLQRWSLTSTLPWLGLQAGPAPLLLSHTGDSGCSQRPAACPMPSCAVASVVGAGPAPLTAALCPFYLLGPLTHVFVSAALGAASAPADTAPLSQPAPMPPLPLVMARSAGLLQVHLQTQQEVKMRMMGMAMHVIRNDGVLALYNGLSASLCRQMTYSLTRFGIYETARNHLGQGRQGPPPFYQKVLLAAAGGFTGGFVGTPADMVNVRMQNDMKQPPAQRRNYSHALDGMYRVLREEGLKKLFSGASAASCRGALVTVGQLSCYDQAKQLVLATGLLSDNVFTHFLSSFIAGGCATFLCQPLDVLKTRLMNSHGEYRGITHCAMETAKLGPLAFYKGFVPAAVRLVPQTVLTFLFLEQLRKYFGIKVTT